MEAVAISVAKSTLNLVVKIAAKGITQEFGLLLGVQEELLFIKQEFEMLQAFLQDDSTERVHNDVTTTWIQHVNELAIDLEDCLQEASIHLIDKSCLLAMCSFKERGRIARKIRALKARTSDVINRKERYYRLNKKYGGHKNEWIDSTRSIANVELEAVLVGLDKPKRKLVDLIRKKHTELIDEPWKGKVISVVGMGGLGKTTLVREVYGCQEIVDEFNYYGWVTVQHPFNKDEFIESLAKQILSDSQVVDDKGGTMKNKVKESKEHKVKEYLKDKKYLIVLDNLSRVSEWDMIKDVLSPNNGSRIIVTTRFRCPLAEHISHPSENIYVIKELSKHDALGLFLKAVYKIVSYPRVSDEGPISNDINEENSEVREQCITMDMKSQAGLIVESCGRLPLAIVTIGSYLATKPKTSAEWKAMHDHLGSELANNRDLGAVYTVLTSSYDGMPKQLKQCLLYLSVFHNHKEIRRSRIIRRWMADELIKEDRKKMVEDIGKDYFYDLMWRSLIQPSQMSTFVNGDVQRCNIHDMIYKLILEKAVDASTVLVLEDENLKTMKTNMVRHLVITGEAGNRNRVLETMDLSHMRSVSIFGMVGNCLNYCEMKLVRVLDLEGTINFNDKDLRSIGKFRHLKYLGLRGTKITKLPNSLRKLSELETLDIRNTGVVQLPRGLTKLHKLSYLRAGFDLYSNQNIKKGIKHYGSVGVKTPRGIAKLWHSLNILGMIDIGRSKNLAKELQNLTKLRKLAVTCFTKKNGRTLGKVIDGLKHLRSLVLIDEDNLGLKCCLESVSFPPKYLQSLELNGRIGRLPDWISSLENLEKIHCRETCLIQEIDVIEKLPNLKILYMSYNSFEEDVKELCFSEGTFPMLQVMIIEGIYGLESVLIKKTALKRLELLKTGCCESIRGGGVSGLEFLVQLKELELVGYSYDDERDRELVTNIKEQLKKLPKGPVLKVQL